MGITAAVVVAGGAAGYAWADPTAKSTTHVDGLDNVDDDFTDHVKELGGPLCDGCDNSNDTDLVVMWQSMLAADGHLAADQIDGDFGPNTAKATANWQDQDHELPPTGEVGQESWAAAGLNLKWDGDDGYLRYEGADKGHVQLMRDDEKGGAYAFVSVTSAEGHVRINTSDNARIELFDATIDLTVVKTETFVDGYGDITDDFGDHYGELGGPLCETDCAALNNSDVVLLWESILEADGYLRGGGPDAQFDNETMWATKEWQAEHGLKETGQVDKATWATADDALAWGEGEDEGSVRYVGKGQGEVVMARTEGGDGGYTYQYYTSSDGYSMWNERDNVYIDLYDETIILARG